MGKWFKLQPGTLKPHKMMDYSTWFEFQVCPHAQPHNDICSWWAPKHIGVQSQFCCSAVLKAAVQALCASCACRRSAQPLWEGYNFSSATGGGLIHFHSLCHFVFSSWSVMGNLSAMAWWNQNMLCNNNEKDTDWQAWHYGLQSAQSSPWQRPKDASSVCGGTFQKSF